jgi:hypothetical protein
MTSTDTQQGGGLSLVGVGGSGGVETGGKRMAQWLKAWTGWLLPTPISSTIKTDRLAIICIERKDTGGAAIYQTSLG